jgi:hypothetical protein
MKFDVRDNFPQVKRLLDEQRRQVPFAVALALTRTAQDVKKAEQAEMRSAFDRPTPFTLNSLFIKPATKQSLEARVWVKDTERPTHYLLPQIAGGDRSLKRFEQLLVQRGVMRTEERAVPGGAAKLDAYGNVSRGQIVKILSQLQAFNLAGSTANASGGKRSKVKRARESYFVSTGPGTRPMGKRSWRNGRMQQTLPRGVWVRKPHNVLGSFVQPVLLFVSRAAYRTQFMFDEVAQSTIARVLPGHLDAAIERALATARPLGGSA